MKSEKLYWWKDEKNFGDFASWYIVSHLAKNKIEWAFPQTCVHTDFLNFLRSIKYGRQFKLSSYVGYVYPWQRALFAIGSILDFANSKTIVWGSGYREYNSHYRNTNVLAVRGKLSLDKLPSSKKNNVALGDPGLLLPLVYDNPQKQTSDVTIIPHFVDYSYFKGKYSSSYEVLDVRTTDLEGMIDKIRKSRYVLSSSLHGLIFAHAYGIPALWIRHNYVNSSDFKYFDYFSAVDIPAYKGESDDEKLLSSLSSIEDYFLINVDKANIKNETLKRVQLNLLESFPYDLKPQYNNLIR